jgi:ACR3 family arsenite efflux pump ArsB
LGTHTRTVPGWRQPSARGGDQKMSLEIASLFLIVFAVIIIVWGIAVVHTLPGKIAKKRGHSQVEAIEITSYLGLLVFPLWMAALIWAYLVPVRLKATVETQTAGKPVSAPEQPAVLQVGDEQTGQTKDGEA